MTGHRFSENGLLPRVDDGELDWLRSGPGTARDPLDAAVLWVRDIAEHLHFVWPAARHGVLKPPPLAHVLDGLVRGRISGDGGDIDTELTLHPEAGTVAVVDSLPDCDLCSRHGESITARYDAPVGDSGRGMTAWGNLCPDHYMQHSTGRLGVGEGQFLLTSDEVPREVYEALDDALSFWNSWRS